MKEALVPEQSDTHEPGPAVFDINLCPQSKGDFTCREYTEDEDGFAWAIVFGGDEKKFTALEGSFGGAALFPASYTVCALLPLADHWQLPDTIMFAKRAMMHAVVQRIDRVACTPALYIHTTANRRHRERNGVP